MDLKELRQMNIDALKDLLKEKKSILVEERINLAKGEFKGNIRKTRNLKKEIAKILTIINEKLSKANGNDKKTS
jgi:ribosomal protein L29